MHEEVNKNSYNFGWQDILCKMGGMMKVDATISSQKDCMQISTCEKSYGISLLFYPLHLHLTHCLFGSSTQPSSPLDATSFTDSASDSMFHHWAGLHASAVLIEGPGWWHELAIQDPSASPLDATLILVLSPIHHSQLTSGQRGAIFHSHSKPGDHVFGWHMGGWCLTLLLNRTWYLLEEVSS